MAVFFQHLTKFLNITHRTSATMASRSNGLAENLVQRVAQMIKHYCDNDSDIDDALPIIEMSLRATAHTRLQINPYEIMFGRQMRVSDILDCSATPPFAGDRLAYYKWLTDELKVLHEGIKQNRIEIKQDDKVEYDKRHKVVSPSWKVGDLVLL